MRSFGLTLSAAILAAAFVLAPAADTVEIEDLYSAQTIVTGTEEPERTRGFRAGLQDVLIKLTGDARLAGSELLVPLLRSPHRYVQQFEYEDRMKEIPVHDEQGTRERPHFLRMRFDRSEIDRALDRLGLAKWPADRPLVAVWLGVETANGRYVLRASGPEGYGQRAVLVETAERRGIPLALPPDEAAGPPVAFEDVADHNLAKLRAASPGADALLAGVLSLGDMGYWDIRWQLDWQGRTWRWAMNDVSFDTALRQGLEGTALALSGKDPGRH